MTFLDSNEARGGLKSRGFMHHAQFICTAIWYKANLLLYLHLHWRLGALTLISWKQPLTQRSTGPCLQHDTSGTIACCASATIVHSSASVLYIVCPHILLYVSFHLSYPCILLLLLLLHTCVTITFVLYCDLQNVTVVSFCWKLQPGFAKGPIFLMGDKSGCLLLDGTRACLVLQEHNLHNTWKVLPGDTDCKYYHR